MTAIFRSIDHVRYHFVLWFLRKPMPQSLEPSSDPDELAHSAADDEEILSLSADDIEAAYERALQAVTSAEQAIDSDDDQGPFARNEGIRGVGRDAGE